MGEIEGNKYRGSQFMRDSSNSTTKIDIKYQARFYLKKLVCFIFFNQISTLS